MNCSQCGSEMQENAKYCTVCGNEFSGTSERRVGYSMRIDDPAFAKFIKNANRWSLLLPVVLAPVTMAAFYYAGKMGLGGLTNPLSVFMGVLLGILFLAAGVAQVIGRKNSKTWDGVIEDKMMKKKLERKQVGKDRSFYTEYFRYSLVVRSDSGKKHILHTRGDDTLYEYFSIGDRVRHHKGLRTLEKYDKTGDTSIPCNACGKLCDIRDDRCFACGCLLLT